MLSLYYNNNVPQYGFIEKQLDSAECSPREINSTDVPLSEAVYTSGTHNPTAKLADLILLDASAGNITFNMSANTLNNNGHRVAFVRVDNTANTVTINPSGGTTTIEGSASISLTTQWETKYVHLFYPSDYDWA
jgi:plastocyanin